MSHPYPNSHSLAGQGIGTVWEKRDLKSRFQNQIQLIQRMNDFFRFQSQAGHSCLCPLHSSKEEKGEFEEGIERRPNGCQSCFCRVKKKLAVIVKE